MLKNHVHFMYGDKFVGVLYSLVQPDLSVPDVPKTIAWCQDSLCVGFKRDYYLIKVLRLFCCFQCLSLYRCLCY